MTPAHDAAVLARIARIEAKVDRLLDAILAERRVARRLTWKQQLASALTREA